MFCEKLTFKSLVLNPKSKEIYSKKESQNLLGLNLHTIAISNRNYVDYCNRKYVD